MNGPRLQVNVLEGWENTGAVLSMSSTNIHWSSLSDIDHTNIQKNDLVLQDTFEGKQKLVQMEWLRSNGNSVNMYAVREKMAFKTNVPDIYVIVTTFRPDAVFFGYVHVGTYPIYANRSSIPARTLSFTLPRDKWKRHDNALGGPVPYARQSGNIYAGYNAGFYVQYDYHSSGSDAAQWDGFTTTTCPLTKAVDSNNITFTLEFPAQYNCIRAVSQADIWDIAPNFMQGRKMGNVTDRVLGDLTTTSGHAVAKVYSPQKGSLCLKSLTNGEIPIMNE